jgi:hypothetical protein
MSKRSDLPITHKLDHALQNLLRSPSREQKTFHLAGGKFTRRDMLREDRGESTVFMQKTVTAGVNTCVGILVDLSSSMGDYDSGNHSKAVYAEMACRMIARAVERAQAPLWIAGFSGSGHGNAALKLYKSTGQRCANVTTGDMNRPMGGTPLTAAMIASVKLFREGIANRATSSLLIVLTDGECDNGPDGVALAETILKRQGVDVFGIGIGFRPRGLTHVVEVTDLEQLGASGLEGIKDLIIQRNRGASR